MGPAMSCGEHGNVEQQVHEAFLHRSLAAVHVNKIADRLENIEADANGERHFGHVHGQTYGIEDIAEEAEIFESAEEAQVEGEADDEGQFAVTSAACHGQTGKVVYHHADKHQEDIHRLAPGVEEEREDDQCEVA